MIGFVAMMALSAVQPAEETPYAVFDADAGGWSVVRRADGCFMLNAGGQTDLSVYYNIADEHPFVSVLFSNSGWHFTEGDLRGYRIELEGSGGYWDDLAGHTWQDEEDDYGVVRLNFSEDAIVPLLGDISHASNLVFSRDGREIARLDLPNAATGVERLLDCVQTVSSSPRPAIAARGRGPAQPQRLE